MRPTDDWLDRTVEAVIDRWRREGELLADHTRQDSQRVPVTVGTTSAAPSTTPQSSPARQPA